MPDPKEIVNNALTGETDEPSQYVDWLSQKTELGNLQNIKFGYFVITSNEDTIRENAVEAGILKADATPGDDEAFWEQMNKDIGWLEANAQQIGREAGLYVQDEGHGPNGDRYASAWILATLPQEQQIAMAKKILDVDEMLSTTSGTLWKFFPTAATQLYRDVSEEGRKVLDVSVEFSDTEPLREWLRLNLLESTDVDDPETFVRHYVPRLKGNLNVDFNAIKPDFPDVPNYFYRQNVDGLILFRYNSASEMRGLLKSMKQNEGSDLFPKTYCYKVPNPRGHVGARQFLEQAGAGPETMKLIEKTNAPIYFYIPVDEFHNYMKLVYPQVKLREDLAVDDPEAFVKNFNPFTYVVIWEDNHGDYFYTKPLKSIERALEFARTSSLYNKSKSVWIEKIDAGGLHHKTYAVNKNYEIEYAYDSGTAEPADIGESEDIDDPAPYLDRVTGWIDTFLNAGFTPNLEDTHRGQFWKRYECHGFNYLVTVGTREPRWIIVERNDAMYGTNRFRRVFEYRDARVEIDSMVTEFKVIDRILTKARTSAFDGFPAVDEKINYLYRMHQRERGFKIKEAVDDPEIQHYLNQASPEPCFSCGADLTQPNTVVRTYISKLAGHPDLPLSGHYDPTDGTFAYEEKPPLEFWQSISHCDLPEDCDACVACGKSTAKPDSLRNESVDDPEVQHYLDQTSSESCKHCSADLTTPSSVSRKYLGNPHGNFVTKGHYNPNPHPIAGSIEQSSFVADEASDPTQRAMATTTVDLCTTCAKPTMRRYYAEESVEPEANPETYLNQIHDVQDITHDIQNYGMFVNRIEHWGKWVILGGGAYWATLHGTDNEPPLKADFFREQLEKFMAALGITQFHIKAGQTGIDNEHVWFKIGIPKSQLTAHSWEEFKRNTTGWPDEPHSTWLPESTDPDDPAVNIERHTAALDLPAIMNRLGFKPLRWKHLNVDYWEKVIGPRVWRVEVNAAAPKATVTSRAAFGTPESWVETTEDTIPINQIESVLSFLEKQKSATDRPDAPSEEVDEALAVPDPDDADLNVERYAQHVEQTRQWKFDSIISRAEDDFALQVERRGINNARAADELVGELAFKWGEGYGYKNGSDEYDWIVSALNNKAGELFPGNWEDYPPEDHPVQESDLVSDKMDWTEFFAPLIEYNQLSQQAADRYAISQNLESNEKLYYLFLEADEASQYANDADYNACIDKILRIIRVTNMRYNSAIKGIMRDVPLDEAKDDVDAEAYIKSQPLEVMARAYNVRDRSDALKFNCAPWFEQATLEDLVDLAKGSTLYGPFNRSFSADIVAGHMARLIPALKELRDRSHKLDVYINEDDAKRWMEHNRADWYAYLWPNDMLGEGVADPDSVEPPPGHYLKQLCDLNLTDTFKTHGLGSNTEGNYGNGIIKLGNKATLQYHGIRQFDGIHVAISTYTFRQVASVSCYLQPRYDRDVLTKKRLVFRFRSIPICKLPEVINTMLTDITDICRNNLSTWPEMMTQFRAKMKQFNQYRPFNVKTKAIKPIVEALDPDSDIDPKQYAMSLEVFDPTKVVEDMTAMGWKSAGLRLAYPNENVWLLEWWSYKELTNDMPEAAYQAEAKMALEDAKKAVKNACPEADQFEWYAPFSDGDFGLYFKIPTRFKPLKTRTWESIDDPTPELLHSTFDVPTILKRMGYERHGEQQEWSKDFRRYPTDLDLMIGVRRRGLGGESNEGDALYDITLYIYPVHDNPEKRWSEVAHRYSRNNLQLERVLKVLEARIKVNNLRGIVPDPDITEAADPDDPETVLKSYQHGLLDGELKRLRFTPVFTQGVIHLYGQPMLDYWTKEYKATDGSQHALYLYFVSGHKPAIRANNWNPIAKAWYQRGKEWPTDALGKSEAHFCAIIRDLDAAMSRSAADSLPPDQEHEAVEAILKHHREWYDQTLANWHSHGITGQIGPGRPA